MLINKYHARDLPNHHGLTAWDAATLSLQESVIDALCPREGINIDAIKLWIAARKGDVAAIEQHVKNVHPDRTIGNYGETTPLIQAIISGGLPAVTSLADCGASINKADKDGASPLYYSLGFGGQPIQPTIVKFLVSHGANVTQPMNDGDTTLHMASYTACVGGMKLLIDHGANVDAVNNQDKTPLHVLLSKTTLQLDQKITAVKYLLCKSASSTLKDGDGHDANFFAQKCIPDALPFLEQPENLPMACDFEASISGELSPWS